MNSTFKVVFNKARGALMVVNEATLRPGEGYEDRDRGRCDGSDGRRGDGCPPERWRHHKREFE